MALKKSPSNHYAQLRSQDDLVILLDVELQRSCVLAGLLCLHGNYRNQIDDNTSIDLFDGADFIAKVQLSSDFVGDKNGYFTNLTLKIV
jgi:hypothetical protein